MSRVLSLFLLFLTGCSTISNRTLPVVAPPASSPTPKSVLVEFTNPESREDGKKFLIDGLITSKQFKNVIIVEPIVTKSKNPKKLENHYPIQSDDTKWDLKLQADFESNGFYETYCALVLEIIPCTPPINWILKIKALDKIGKTLGEYMVEEKATEIYWIFGIFTRSSGEERRKALFQNMLNNVYVKMRQDGVI